MILLSLKALAGGKVHPFSAVGTEGDSGEHSLALSPLKAPVTLLAQRLYPVPQCFRNDRFLGAISDHHVLWLVGDAFLQFVRLGVGLKVAGASGVFDAFEDRANGGV